MIKQISISVLTLFFLVSCVSPKVYKELEGKYNNLKKENRKLSDENDMLLSAKTLAQNELKQLLFIYRHDKWDLPKGKIEKGETLQNAAIREVKEECGFRNLDLGRQVSTTYHIYEEKGRQVLKISYWFQMFSEDHDLKPQVEEGITEVQWMDEAKMAKILKNTYPNIELLLSEYRVEGQ